MAGSIATYAARHLSALTVQNAPRTSRSFAGQFSSTVRTPLNLNQVLSSFIGTPAPNTGQARFFFNRVGLGVNSPQSDRFFANNEMSTDSAGPLSRMLNQPEQYGKQLQAYKEDFRKVNGQYPARLHAALQSRPWQTLDQADRELIHQRGTPYVSYYRAAVQTAFERQGDVHFYLGGGLDVGKYVTDILTTERNEGTSFDDFCREVDWPTLSNLDYAEFSQEVIAGLRDEDDPNAPEVRDMPAITTVELYDLTVGAFSEHAQRAKYHADDGTQLDTGMFLKLHERLLATVRGDENRKAIEEGRPMTDTAQKAVQEFQRYLRSGVVPGATLTTYEALFQ